MPKQVEFYYDFSSPNAYIAWTQLPGLVKKTSCEIVYKPMLLGGIYKIIGSPIIPVKEKIAYVAIDLPRVAKELNVLFSMNSHFPINTVPLMRGAIVAQKENFLDAYLTAMYHAVWVDNKNMTAPEVVGSILKAANIDGENLMRKINEESIKEQLKINTQAAADRGVFGAPTFFVDNEMYWGRDRMHHVEQALI